MSQDTSLPSELERLRKRVAELEAVCAARERSSERLQLAVRGTTDGLWYRDLATGTERWTTRFREMIGYGEDELEASFSSWLSLLHPDDRERAREAVQRHIAGEERYDIEYRLRTRDDGYRWFHCRGVVERDEAGQPIEIAGALQDITERKAVDDALRREKEFSESVINCSLDGILAFDRDCRYTSWNPAMERISGVPRSATLGRCAFDVFPFLVQTGEDRFFREALEGRTQITRDRRYVVPETGHEGFYEGYYSPLRNESDEIIGGLAIIRDVTERKRAETQRAELEEQLRQSQKMDAIGQLAGGIAHDFNNLLTAVLGSARLILPRLEASQDAVRRGIERIMEAGERAAMLTQQLLAFSRKQVSHPQVLNMRLALDSLTALLQPLIREDIELVLTRPPRPCHVRIDPGELQQVIMNLVMNASDAMPDGGTLTIDCRRTEPAPQDGGQPQVELAVSDTGVGMDRDQMGRVFEPFFTTKPVGRGTGLGLATVYGIVTRAGGQIGVESEPGRGTRFQLTLPAVDELTPVSEQGPAAPAGGTETVLVCEDGDAVREVLREILEDAGYTVIAAAHGGEALEAAGRAEDTIDLLISDVVMPVMNGRELHERMIVDHPDVRVLFISGYADDVLGEQLRHGHPGGYLQKPFTPDELLEAVRKQLDSPPAAG